jgi:hypothetical protein
MPKICRYCKRTDEEVDFYAYQPICEECSKGKEAGRRAKERELIKKAKYSTLEKCAEWNREHKTIKFEAETFHDLAVGGQENEG